MSKRKLSGKALAIQLGWYETHIVLVDKNAEILHGISVPTPAGAVEDGVIRDEAAVRQMLKEALAAPEFKRVRNAVFTLVTSQVIIETATTPDLPAGKLEKLIQANMDMYFPVDVQDCHVVWQPIAEKVTDGVKELEVQLWAVPNSILGAYYTVANDCGLSVAAIDYCGNSITSAVGASYCAAGVQKERQKLSLNMELGKKKEAVEPVVEQNESGERAVPATDLHITMEKELLGMTFVQNGRVVQQRFIQSGPNPVYQIGEIAMMVEYFQGLDLGRGSKLRGILSGALAEETALIAELSDVLDIPLSTFPVTYDTSWFLCMGAALTTLDFGIPALNRPGKARREFQSQIWQYGLILVGGLAVLAVVMLTMTSRLGWETEIRALESEQQVLSIRSAQSDGFADNYYAYQNEYQSYSGDWDTIFNSLQTYNDNLVLVMEEMEDLMPDQSSVVGMQIGSTGLNVTFATETKEQAAYLMMALREMQYADLAGISSLQGGGAGPATSYGSKESAPSEGSSTTRKTWDELTVAEKQTIYQPIIDDVTKWELAYYFGLGKGITDNMDALHAAIGMTPSEVEGEIDLTPYTWEERAAAFTAMFTTNPFAMMRANSLLMGAVENDLESPLAQYILTESTLGAFDLKFHTSVSDLQDDVEELVDVITWPNPDYDALADTEELLLTDQTLKDWYSYYLYHYKGADLETAEAPNCISTDKIIYAVVNTPEAEPVGKTLYKDCLSDATRALIEEVTKVETTPDDTTAPDENTGATEGTTEDTTDPDAERKQELTDKLPDLMTEYLEDGKLTSVGTTDRVDYNTYLGITSLESYLDEQHAKYLNGTLEDGEMKAAIKAYYDSLPDEPEDTTGGTEGTEDTENTEGTENTENTEDTSDGGDIDVGTKPTTKPTTEPTTEATTDPTTESTIDPTTDSTTDSTDPSIEDDGNTSKLELVLQYYLPTYIMQGKVTLTGDYKEYERDVNDLLDLYFGTGSTETEIQGVDVDKTLNDTIAKGTVDAYLAASMIQYLENPAGLKAPAIRDMLDNYYAGGTGNTTLDTQLDKIKESLGDYLAAWLAKYLSSNSTGNTYGDPIIKDYLEDGKTNSLDNTEALDNAVSEKKVDSQLSTLIQMYTLSKDQLKQYPVLFGLMDNYYTQANRTGSEAMDNRIKELDKALLDKFAESAMNASKGGGGGGNQEQAEPDTRYFFAVSLMYKPELLEAELERKGLDYDAKVPELEVAE